MSKVMNVVVVAMLAVPSLVIGQAGDVNKVLADMKAAIGGAEKVAAVKTLTATGRTLRTNAAGTATENEFELAMELPDKYMMRAVLANLGTMSVYRNSGFNGDGLINMVDQPPSLGGGGGTMVVRAAGGPAGGGPPTPEQTAQANRQILQTQKRDFGRLALGLFGSSYPSFPLEFSYGGEAEAADGKAWIVDVKGAEDFTARLFIDTKTHLPLMQSWMALEPIAPQVMRGGGPGGGGQTVTMGGGGTFTSTSGATSAQGGRQLTPEERDMMMKEMQAQRAAAEANRKMVEYRIYYSDYKAVSGVKLPHKLQRSIDGKPTEEMTFDQIRVNPKIDARKFEVTK
jgi:hypothetical protein